MVQLIINAVYELNIFFDCHANHIASLLFFPFFFVLLDKCFSHQTFFFTQIQLEKKISTLILIDWLKAYIYIQTIMIMNLHIYFNFHFYLVLLHFFSYELFCFRNDDDDDSFSHLLYKQGRIIFILSLKNTNKQTNKNLYYHFCMNLFFFFFFMFVVCKVFYD